MALDELKENDQEFDDRGIKYVVETSLFDRIKPIKVDYTTSAMGSGFSIVGNMPVMPSSCGTSCSC